MSGASVSGLGQRVPRNRPVPRPGRRALPRLPRRIPSRCPLVRGVNSLILTSLSPSVLPLGATREAVLRLLDTDSLPCANLVLEFTVSGTLSVERGRRQIELVRLEPGRPYDHQLRLRAVAPGHGVVSLTNFSYRDGLGNPQRIRGRTKISVEIGDPEPVGGKSSTSRVGPDLSLTDQRPPVLFISYRRSDGRWIAGRLAEHLRRRYSRRQVFLDSRSIRIGEDFRRRLDVELDSCVALLWRSSALDGFRTPSSGRRASTTTRTSFDTRSL